ncbi:MAG: cysteine-rich CWC family protein [Piscinibacter sp.]|uniref:cysteine-rich CWC family protein n=1 Tax=Piscinibacter sp. TaxID=1903157 RepID=UPI00258A68EB|nr:cysteine-rich CWC family protein [Piscinibacter sp.]MCW5665712.1 cysteine-rich CWC family protein [Piscinibacter sp.]
MPELPPADSTRCPRCGGAFHCGANDPGPCACTTLRLDAATLARLSAAYRGCLCLRCLAELSGAPDAGRAPGQTSG